MKTPAELPTIVSPFGDGDVAAELGILPDIFFPHNEISRKALSEQTSLIIGRRGAGKSALGHWLAFTRTGNARHYTVHVGVDNVVLFAPIVTALADKLKSENHAVETLASAWRLALMHALMIETLKDSHFANTQGVLEVDRYVKTKLLLAPYASPSHVVLRIFELITRSLTPNVSSGASISASVAVLEASRGYQDWLAMLPMYLARGKRAVIVIDTLEEYRVQEESVQISMAALLHAVTEMTKARRVAGLEVKVMLPAEAAQSLEDQVVLNVAKTFDKAVFMHWRRKDLLRLMCWRLLYHLEHTYKGHRLASMPAAQNLDWSDHPLVASRVWNAIFPAIRDDGTEADAFAYISRFTQLRPRQFVILCNAIAQKAHERGTFPRIEWRDIGAGIGEQVDTLASEVLASYRGVYGDPRSVVATLAQSEISGGRLSYGTVDNLASRVKASISNPDFWRLLLETGVLGVVTRETPIYTEARFEYIVRQRLVPNVNDVFVIHPMFFGLLGLRHQTNQKPVFPIGPEDLTVEP